MTLDLDALEKVAQEANLWGAWAIWEDLTEEGFVHVGNVNGVIPEGQIATPEGAEVNPIAKCYTGEIAEHVVTFDPETVLALIAEVKRLVIFHDHEKGRADDLEAERDALQAKLDAVRKVHERTWEQRHPTATLCWGCDLPVPCPTNEAIGGTSE